MGARESRSHPLSRLGLINGRDVHVLLDTGSHYTFIKASVAIKYRLSVRSVEGPLNGIGSTTIPPISTIGETKAKVAVDAVCPGEVLLLVSDQVQTPDVIIGRSWSDLPTVAYYKT